MTKHREQWGSRVGFIFATVGSAIGLGNIWRFPTVVGQSGGGAFLLLYLIIIILIGLPLMIGELTIGRKGKRNIVSTFKQIAPNSAWWIIGSIGITTGFVVLSFYSVISGWSLSYIFKFITGQFTELNSEKVSDVFNNLVQNPIIPLLWQALFLLLTIGIVILGIDKGIERASKILMPVLFLLLFLLGIRSVTLDGSTEGIIWFFRPNFTVMSMRTVLDALGQVFFSLSLGMGAIITYGSYLSDKENIPQSGIIISLADLSIAILAGIIIIPAVFAFNLEPNVGPPLIFITLPMIFGAIPYGNIFGSLFFLLLSVAAITSSISLLEVIVSYFIEEFHWTRKKASILIGLIIFILSIPSSFSMGILREYLILDMRFLDFMDALASNLLLPLAGLLTAIFIGWVWTPKKSLEELNKGKTNFKYSNSWAFITKFILPLVLSYILVTGLLKF